MTAKLITIITRAIIAVIITAIVTIIISPPAYEPIGTELQSSLF